MDHADFITAMSTGVGGFLVRREVTSSAAEIASMLAGRGYCALLSYGAGPVLEVIHRDGLPPEVCGALGLEAGRNLLAEAGRSGRALRLRGEHLRETYPDLHWALQEYEVQSLALVPLLGDSGTEGFVCVWLPRGWDGGAEGFGGSDNAGWRRACRVPGILQLAAGCAALETILQERELTVPGGVDGVVVLDQEHRVVLAQGFVSRLAGWREGGSFGRLVKGLPGGRAMAALGEDEPGRLLWKSRTLPGPEGRDVPVRMARLPWMDSGTGARHGTVCLLQDQGPSGNGTDRALGELVLELGLRVSHAAQPLRCLCVPDPPDEATAAPPLEATARTHAEGKPSLRSEGTLARRVEEATALVRAALDKAREDENRAMVDVAPILRNLVQEYSEPLLEERIRILPILGSELPEIVGDAHRLTSALRALLESSRRSLRAGGGTLFVRAWENDGTVMCTMADDGAGRGRESPEEAIYVEPLFREARPPSLGDDLAVVKGVVDEMGGRLVLESREELWTRITLIFPAARQRSRPAASLPAGLPPPVEVRSAGGEALEVLVVDDNEAVRAILRRCLERRGHLVTEARDGGEALELVRSRCFDRLMVDIHMPGVTGMDFFEGLEQVAPAMRERTLFMTGGVQEEAVDRYLERAGRPALDKPFHLGELIRILEAWIG